MSPATSVVLATYEGEAFLGPLLASLRNQVAPPHELVVSDDGSSDGTLDIVEDFARTAPFDVKVDRSPNHLGHAGNFLRGLELATGRYVAWCDQDDVWNPRKIQRCEQVLDRLGVEMVVHAARRIDASGSPLGHLGGMRAPFQRRMRGERFAVPHGFRQVFRRDLFEGLAPDDRPTSTPGHEPALHDEWSFLLANATGSVLWLPLRLVDYRVHGDNWTPAAAEPSIWQRSVSARPEDPNRQRGRSAAERAVHLTEVARRRHGRRGEAAAASADAYREVAPRYVARTRIYEPGARRARLRALAELCVRGAYRSGVRGGLGPRSLVRDALEVVRG